MPRGEASCGGQRGSRCRPASCPGQLGREMGGISRPRGGWAQIRAVPGCPPAACRRLRGRKSPQSRLRYAACALPPACSAPRLSGCWRLGRHLPAAAGKGCRPCWDLRVPLVLSSNSAAGATVRSKLVSAVI